MLALLLQRSWSEGKNSMTAGSAFMAANGSRSDRRHWRSSKREVWNSMIDAVTPLYLRISQRVTATRLSREFGATRLELQASEMASIRCGALRPRTCIGRVRRRRAFPSNNLAFGGTERLQ